MNEINQYIDLKPFKSEFIDLGIPSSWKVQLGFVHGVVGENGVGKTTLIQSLKSLKQSVRISYQDQEILKTSLDCSIGEIKNFLFNSLDGFNLDVFKNLSSKFDVDLGESKFINELSGGESQSFKLLITLSQEADLYIFDEPFSFLSEYNQESLINIFKNLGKTIIIIDHNKERLTRLIDKLWIVSQVNKEIKIEAIDV